ncbi:hypothetical protein ACHAW6_005093 [Cyclotella cf. meneghiniana]
MVFMTMWLTSKANSSQTGWGIFHSPISEAEILSSYSISMMQTTSMRLCPQLQKLDNESLHDVGAFNTKSNASFQYTPSEIHRTNIAERDAQVWKHHFIAKQAGKSYHLPNWCKYLEQTNIILNMMRPCTQNPNLSVHEALEGMFSFNITPVVPIGTECMIHVKPDCCHTWGYHAIKAWYFAPALNHYQCILPLTLGLSV